MGCRLLVSRSSDIEVSTLSTEEVFSVEWVVSVAIEDWTVSVQEEAKGSEGTASGQDSDGRLFFL